jgi:CheY-like chemotaxis protein
LLCKSNESEAAFSLCRNGTLDDYLVNRPMHDPYRLRLAVLHAQVRYAKRSQSVSLNRQLSHIGSDLRHLDSFVNKTLSSGQANHAESLQSFRDFASRFTQELDQFAVRMSDSLTADSTKLMGYDGLCEQFDKLRNERIVPDARQVENQLQKSQQWINQFEDGLHEQLDQLGKQEFPLPQPEILLVDDDDFYREMLGTMLEEVGFRVSMADGGEVALAAMHKRRPHVVLLDYQMPGLDGMATLKKIHADPNLRQVPVLLLTGVSDRETVREVIANGAAGYIVKPSNRPTILAKIRNLLPK